MPACIELGRAGSGGVASACLVASLAVMGPRLAGQSILDQFSSENLAPSAVGVDLGALGGTHVGGAQLAALRLDLGRVAPRVRVLLGISYFRADLTSAELARFAARLKSLVIDPTADDTIRLGKVTWGDLTGDLDLQYLVSQHGGVMAYAGLGASVHVRHGSGTAIDGTFVQDALDGISPGLNATLGAEFGTGRWRFALEGRGVLASGLSTIGLSCGVRYRWAGR